MGSHLLSVCSQWQTSFRKYSVVLFALLLVPTTTIAVTSKVDVVDVISVEYPPFTSAKLPDHGFAHKKLKEYAQKNFKVELNPLVLPPARAQQFMLSGNWCLSFYPPANQDRASSFVPLDESVVMLGLYRIKQSSPFNWTSLEELNGAAVAVLRSDQAYQHLLESLRNAGLRTIGVETVEQGLRLMLSERVQYAFGDNVSVEYLSFTEQEKARLQFSETTLAHSSQRAFLSTNAVRPMFIEKISQNKIRINGCPGSRRVIRIGTKHPAMVSQRVTPRV